MKNIKSIIVFLLCIGFGQTTFAKEPNKSEKPNSPKIITTNSEINLRIDCAPSRTERDIQINNVQARLQVGGDIWWDRDDGRYIVPKVAVGSNMDEVSSLFAGGVWLGGFDPGGSLKVAASTYGQGGYDYYPGPLDDNTGLTESTICQQWDEFFEVTGDEVQRAIRGYDDAINNGLEFSVDSVSLNVRTWPGQGNDNFEDRYGFPLPDTKAGLGSFWDQNDDGVYSPELGDFPIIDIRGCEPVTRNEAKELVPDNMLFWIYNDAGNTHNESDGDAIRMEVQVQAFGYATNDAINDMTFYRYKLINRASEDIRETYFAMWVDPDLGCFTDDYSGCDVSRSLAFTYNADEIDGTNGEDCDQGTPSYGATVPLVGTDYFRGPIAPKVVTDATDPLAVPHVIKKSDQVDGFSGLMVGDSIFIRDPNFGIGEEGDFGFELGMSSCMIYNNAAVGNPPAGTTDPNTPQQYYGYLDAKWLNDEPLTRGGTGLNPGAPEEDITRYAFSDPPNMSGGWSMWEERTNGVGEGDRRTVQASGPFLLKPNAINELIVGAVWVPDVRHPGPSLAKLTSADDIAQSLFDECFDIIDGPDAPSICPIALDQEIILVLHNDSLESNNAFLEYSEIDIFAPEETADGEPISETQRTYLFEGYKIFQLVGPGISSSQLNDVESARIVAQVDLENGITDLYNWKATPNPAPATAGAESNVWIPELKVSGANQGIQNTFRITTDQFSADDPTLINHKKYYFMAVAYAYNEFARFDASQANSTQPTPYLEGRENISTYIVTPRPIVYDKLNASYGDGAEVTRLHGVGVGGNNLELKEEMYDQILSGTFDGRLEYEEGAGPVTVKVYNPLEVQNGRFQLEIIGDHDPNICAIDASTAIWKLTHVETGKEFTSEYSIDEINEQLIADFGISIELNQTNLVGTNIDANNGALDASSQYLLNDAIPWFRGITDGLQDVEDEQIGFGRNLFNFIKTASDVTDPVAASADPNQRFQTLGDGEWYPFPLVSTSPEANGIPYVSPGWFSANNQSRIRLSGNMLRNMNNVDIIMTPDKSKWSRCIVVETGNQYFFPDDQEMLKIKLKPSLGVNGGSDPSINPTGMSYFPGYAIDVETGKRLNIFFGENSFFNQAFADAANADDNRPDNDGDGLEIGDDMLYNPSDRFFQDAVDFVGLTDPEDYIKLFMGGHHYVYVTRQEYDGCDLIRNRYDEGAPLFSQIDMYQSVTWCSMTMCQPGQSLLPYSDVVIPSELKFRLRVEKPYNIETAFNILNTNASCFPADDSRLPLYEFEIVDKQLEELVEEEFESALDNVLAVPNPYYAYSAYETGATNKTIKITNLPARAIVTIFTLDGKFVTQFDRDERVTERTGANPGVNTSQVLPDIDWNLQNSAGIPIASGVYLIHISAPELGEEKTIKWFGINRKFDPSGL